MAKGEASQEAHAGKEGKSFNRVPSEKSPGFANRVLQIMILDKRSGLVEFRRRARRQILDGVGTLPSVPANR